MPARIMIVGEAPGEQEEQLGVPFVGNSGEELNRMLTSAGIMRSECYTTYVVKHRPLNNWIGNFVPMKKKDVTPTCVALKDRMVMPVVVEGYNMLLREIADVRPNVIVPVGNLALWALTGKWGITKWRGSHLRMDRALSGELPPKVIPTYHPSAVLRQWEWRHPAILDLKRVARNAVSRDYPHEPQWRFTLRPSFMQVLDRLQQLHKHMEAGNELWLDFDIETRAGHIACAGISWSVTEALIIPFMCVERKEGYWQLEEESFILWWLWKVLTHTKVKVRWQNGLYDAQYTWRWWHFVPRGVQDTMISQHVCFVELPKSLAFQASMYCDHHVYWKDDGKEWDKKMGEETLWSYNGVDCVRTREVGEAEAENIKHFKLDAIEDFQQRMFWPVLKAMQLGLRIRDDKNPGGKTPKEELAEELQLEISRREDYFTYILGHSLNPQSPAQMHKLFYEDFGEKEILKKKMENGVMVWKPTLDDDALMKIAARNPLLAGLCNRIADHRTLNVWLEQFVLADPGYDGRMRCSYNICGTDTYRLSSSEDAFGTGSNMQNIPSDKSKSVGKAAKRGTMDFELPNIRSLYGPDAGHTFFDMDLDRADLQTVVWESGEPDFKKALRMGVDLHLWNAYIISGKEAPPLDELVESHSNYANHRAKNKYAREFAKVFVHGTNYGGGARTMAGHVGCSVAEAERAQRIWFGAHPGIQKWHRRVEADARRGYVENVFGYRRYIFGRLDLPALIAWIPQSVTGNVINRIWLRVHENLPEVQVLLQVHDSLGGQFPTHIADWCKRRLLEEAARVVVPYDDPLVIPTGVKTSEISWGDCE